MGSRNRCTIYFGYSEEELKMYVKEDEARIIIPSATLVPEELWSLGKLPGIIYPINQKTAFDYLYEQYKSFSKIDIICYERAEKVQRRLNKYIKDGVRIKVLDSLGDLGHTGYFALDDVSEPVIINFADTIVMDDCAALAGTDAFFCHEDYMSETWTYFDEDNGKITNVYDKKWIDSDQKKKLFVGVFSIADSVYFKKCLEEAFAQKEIGMNTFYYALQLYSAKHPMKAILTDNWFDIGHQDKYYNSKLEVRAREFNHISIDKNRGILRTSSDDKDKFIREIKWYLKLPGDIEYVSPRIFDYSASYEDPYISMEYYSYHTLHELFLYGDLERQQWIDIFSRVRFVCEDFKRYTVSDEKIPASLEEMYLTKTLQRFDKLKSDARFVGFFERNITVNGKAYLSLNQIIERLKKMIPETLYDVERFTIIHGDLCFSNIMVDSNFSFIKVIDPRGKFGSFDIYGDPRYELAKLFHSVDGKYDYIIKDLFDVRYDAQRTSIEYSITERKSDFDVFGVFLEAFREEIGSDLKKIELIEALLFLSMIPLHNESFEHQLVMLGTGMDILNRVVDITANGGKASV